MESTIFRRFGIKGTQEILITGFEKKRGEGKQPPGQ